MPDNETAMQPQTAPINAPPRRRKLLGAGTCVGCVPGGGGPDGQACQICGAAPAKVLSEVPAGWLATELLPALSLAARGQLQPAQAEALHRQLKRTLEGSRKPKSVPRFRPPRRRS